MDKTTEFINWMRTFSEDKHPLFAEPTPLASAGAEQDPESGAIVIDLEAHRKFREWLNTHQDMPEDSILWGLTSVDDE